MAPQLVSVSGAHLVQSTPTAFSSLCSCTGSSFLGGVSSTPAFQPALCPPSHNRCPLLVRADISKGKRIVTSKAAKGAGSVIEKEGGAQVSEQGATQGSVSTPPEGLTSQRVEALRRAAKERPKAQKQSSPFDWIGNLALKNPVATGVQNAFGAAAVAVGASLFREDAPTGGDAPETEYALRGNFAPVPEVGAKVPLKTLEGAIPKGFPDGLYVRNGPNPQYMPKTFRSITGSVTKYHWFEGDGMLHAVWFQGGNATFQNKYIETAAYKKEKEAGKPVLMGTLAAENLFENMATNALFHQIPFKHTANTAVVGHSGRLLALMEAGPPHEVEIDDLTTRGVADFDGQLDFPFTAHPKTDPRTGDMVFFGYQVTPPFCSVGVISPSGELVHKTPLDVKRATMMHDFAITEHYNVILDFPLTFDFQRKIRGGELIEFEKDQPAWFGVMPRFGGRSSVCWFQAENTFAFHTLNAYEEGNEIVIHGCASKNPSLNAPADKSASEWFADNLGNPDGGLISRLTEWRVNLITGSVTERLLTPTQISADMPRINENYTGFRNRFGYGLVTDREATVREGMPLFTKLVKWHLPNDGNSQVPIEMDFHYFGPQRFGDEASFVPRDGATEEDDGWLVCYVFDESTNSSELVIVDAHRFSDPPIARLALPQRVPFGLHGSFVATAS